jgi:hypothetical protein
MDEVASDKASTTRNEEVHGNCRLRKWDKPPLQLGNLANNE